MWQVRAKRHTAPCDFFLLLRPPTTSRGRCRVNHAAVGGQTVFQSLPSTRSCRTYPRVSPTYDTVPKGYELQRRRE